MPHHISVRVPWHDNSWNGTVCKHPEYNQACRALRPIALGKSDDLECSNAGKEFENTNEYLPPCLSESGTFMSEKSINTLPKKHPYTYDPRFDHIGLTNYCINSYSFTARPYAWLLRKNEKENLDKKLFNIHFDDSIEVDVGYGRWVSNGTNQKNIFDYFYRDIVPNKSMVIAYAKAIPFIESTDRIIIGIGMITEIEEIKQYRYNTNYIESDIPAYLWERQIGHSIRNSRENGFIFPFNEIKSYLSNHQEQSPDELIVFSPDGYFEEFSYATEHLSYDALILTLNKTVDVLKKYQQIGLSPGSGKSWSECIIWCKEKLEIIWKERGLWPGLGNILQATGISYGHDIAHAIHAKISDNEIWDRLPDVLCNVSDYLPEDMQNIKITKTQFKTWKIMEYDTRMPYLQLLSRTNLSFEQAYVAINPNRILVNSGKPHYADFISSIKEIKFADIIKNPYLLYEQTRLFEDKYRFGIGQIDVAMFPLPIIREETIIEDADDERRLRAIIVSILENATLKGNTLMMADDIVKQVNAFRSDVELDLDISNMTITVLEDFFKKEFIKADANFTDDEQVFAYQLNRFANNNSIDDVIRKLVQSRVEAKIAIDCDWSEHLDFILKQSEKGEYEDASRTEKLKAIITMATSKISVLTGGAGTGKTTTLASLCHSPEIQKDCIIILAPTGKARVVLDTKLREANVNCQKAYTIFQFLQKTYHCDRFTYRYYLSGKTSHEASGATVIIDECSMLTEEMLAALAETISLAQRVILVGDPNQLPPIGAGKPFFELVNYFQTRYPDHLAKLTISNRQKLSFGERMDVKLAKMFTYDQNNEVNNDIFSNIPNDNNNIEFVCFKDTPELYTILFETISKISKMSNINDFVGFDKSMGGLIENDKIHFPDARKIDNWQILSPYRNNALVGSITINRHIHRKYRQNDKNDKLRFWTKNLLGNDGIIYGDKVINVSNQEKKGYPEGSGINYIANGEIGIVNFISNDSHQIIFSSQPETQYYFPSKITDDNSDIELAYALTIHKAQGSGFNTTILIIYEPDNGPNAFITREMIYTALTRQANKIYILYNKNPIELRKYSIAEYSDLARRLTNLFGTPTVCKYKEKFFSNKLIHITRSGELVRSKSEVIIYNELDNANIKFEYEKMLVLPNGKPYSPDFTVYLADGNTIYWEHLGMLSNLEYRKNWEAKKSDYEKFGISQKNGNLYITYDEANGSIDSTIISEIVKKFK